MKNLFLGLLAIFSIAFIFSNCSKEDTKLSEVNFIEKERIERTDLIDSIKIQAKGDDKILSEYTYNHDTKVMKDKDGNEIVNRLVIKGSVYIDKPNDTGGRTIYCWVTSHTCYEN